MLNQGGKKKRTVPTGMRTTFNLLHPQPSKCSRRTQESFLIKKINYVTVKYVWD